MRSSLALTLLLSLSTPSLADEASFSSGVCVLNGRKVEHVGCQNWPIWYRDADGDGYGTLEAYVYSKRPVTGYVAHSDIDFDCDDSDPDVIGVSLATVEIGSYESVPFGRPLDPGWQEHWEIVDGKDNDCDGLIDEDVINESDSELEDWQYVMDEPELVFTGFDLDPELDANHPLADLETWVMYLDEALEDR